MLFVCVYGLLILLSLTNASKVLKLNGGTTDEFKKELQEGSKLWMIDFYAPWCSHCKKLEPLLGELQKDLDTLTSTIGSAAVKIGKLDATVNAEIAKDYNVKSYPTIVFINVESNLVVKYEGSRTKEGFLALIKRLTTNAIININKLDDLNSYPKATVFFLLSFTTNTNTDIKQNFEIVANKHHAKSYFAIINNNKIGSAIISKIEIGRSSNSNRVMANSHNATVNDIDEFVHQNNHQLITNLENHNFKTLGSKNKTMVINIISSKEKPGGLSQQGFDAFETAVEMLPVEVINSFLFCTLDLVKYRRFLKTYNAANVANILFLDYGEGYYSSLDHPSKTKKWLDASGIRDLVIEVLVDKKFEMKQIKKTGILGNLIMKMKNYYPYSLLCFVPLALLLVGIFYPAPEKKHSRNKHKKN